MGYTVTSFRRRLVMGALLTLAIAGGVIRHYADNPSTLRDIGTLLLVLWLPAVGNLIGFLVRQIPRKPPPATDFAEGRPFVAHLRARLQPVPPAQRAAVDLQAPRCTLLVGRRGFTARFAQPVAEILAMPGNTPMPLELLYPAAGLPHLAAGTDFHLLVGTTAVASGWVEEVVPTPP